MDAVRTLIIGGGLAGLYTARLLEHEGDSDYVLLEARATFGGRILSATPDPEQPLRRLDLGATWYWPSLQPELDLLIRELGLPSFEQGSEGDAVFERSPLLQPSRMPGWGAAPPARRLLGGMATLVDRLHAQLDATRLLSATAVTSLRSETGGVVVEAETADGGPLSFLAQRVVLALPPRLAVSAMAFDPPLPDSLAQTWASMATHMAPHAKYIAAYPSAFWKEQGLSGSAHSASGPLREIHDASQPGLPALFGFLLTQAGQRRMIPKESLLGQCRAQMGRLFGRNALKPTFEDILDWADQPYTATRECGSGQMSNAVALVPGVRTGAWGGRIAGAGSEWSPSHPGYVAGALAAPAKALRWLERNAAVGHSLL
ncbi:FAD-dependent oxidoreductase [Stenotrophomonas maltophilia]|uniref:flavin monoamine oxidase family protein n=1 Tax=Stenotrophomonas maltophilia TaxID=40324 RepID=UPI001D108F27|nr:FAD-dependent oxidoreductase [Stenotrophomonas maltophilia]UKJ25460.1 FAD-dependent oxidoreductase [Stenotrophomonas maltophilia]UXB15798.1 FAD-dependent oxidoreductase [Stenotrophomonas maltophilia]WDW04443.1 FAD-dependent oxidoreductase [Stenotrophomonas maltophilia]